MKKIEDYKPPEQSIPTEKEVFENKTKQRAVKKEGKLQTITGSKLSKSELRTLLSKPMNQEFTFKGKVYKMTDSLKTSLRHAFKNMK
jgi:hypothetical protein